MGATTLLAAGTQNLTASVTSYASMGYGGGTGSQTESNIQTPYREAGTLSGAYCNISANDRGASTFTARIATANGNQTFSIGSSTSGEFEDTTHSDTVSAGNLIDGAFAVGAGGTTFTLKSVRYLYTTSGVAYSQRLISYNSNAGSSATSVTYYYPISGINSLAFPNTTEANMQLIVRAAGTLQNMYWRVGANSRADTSQVLRSRINTANGNLVINSVASTTGITEDTTHTDSIASGDKVNYSLTLGSSAANFNVPNLGCSFTTTGTAVPAFNGTSVVNGGTPTGFVYSANTTYYPNFSCGNSSGPDTTESLDKQKSGVAFTGSRLQGILKDNTVTASSTWRFRITGANGNQLLTFTASTTGAFEDTTHTDAVIATDELNYSLVTGATGTNLSVVAAGQMMTFPAAATGLFGRTFLDGLSVSGPKQFTRLE